MFKKPLLPKKPLNNVWFIIVKSVLYDLVLCKIVIHITNSKENKLYFSSNIYVNICITIVCKTLILMKFLLLNSTLAIIFTVK